MKQYIPYTLKLNVKLLRRFVNDTKQGNKKVFAQKKQKSHQFNHQISNKQVIRKSYLYENKIHNLRTGKAKIEEIIILPNQLFSFWKVLGKPTTGNGYKKGRNILNGVLSEDVGGGLCQLSGILFHTAIQAGLKIEERFNHTVDIYKEEDRLSPLGTDATIVYGYKDLRIRNNYSFPIKFSFEITPDYIVCNLLSEKEIKPAKLSIKRNDYPNKREVVVTNTLTNEKYTSVYKLP